MTAGTSLVQEEPALIERRYSRGEPMTKKRFQGTGTAMITPFKSDGSVDEKALRRFVDFQIDGGVDMLLPCGTTGEGATLNSEETDHFVRITVEQSRGRAPVIVGAGSNS